MPARINMTGNQMESFIFDVFACQADTQGMNANNFLHSSEMESFVVHGKKIREALETLTEKDGVLLPARMLFAPGGDATEEERKKICELNRLIIEGEARAAAWSMGDRTRVPFIMHESTHMRVNVDIHGDEKRPEYAAKIGPARIDITMREANAENCSKAIHSARTAVIMSFMMHDVEIAKLLSQGEKYQAAGLAYVADKFASEIASDYEGVTTIHSDDTGAIVSGRAWGAYTVETVQDAFTFAEQTVDGKKAPQRHFETFSDIKKDETSDKIFSAVIDTHTLDQTIKNWAAQVANILWVNDQIKDKDEQGGDGDGEGQGAADKVLQAFAGENPGQGQAGEDEGQGQGESDGEGQGDQDGEGEGEGEDPTEEQRRRVQGRFGSDHKSRQLMELLGVEYEQEVISDTPVSWEDIIHGELLRSLGEERVSNWSRPNRRFIGHDIYLPGFKRKRVRRLAIGIDESGSIDMAKLMKFNAELIRVIDKINPEGVDIFHFSTSVSEESLTQGEIWEAKRVLDGGTSFTAAYKAMNEHIMSGQTYDAVVFFTDMEDAGYRGLKRAVGEEYFPEGTDFYWVVFGGGREPEFGSVINMDTGEFTEYGHL